MHHKQQAFIQKHKIIKVHCDVVVHSPRTGTISPTIYYLNYMLFDEILSGKNNHLDILYPAHSVHNFQTFYVPQINFIMNKLVIFIDPSGQQQY